MIRVSVTLISAVNGSQIELARMDIANDESTTLQNFNKGSYDGVSYRGRDREALSRHTVSKKGRIENWSRQQFHVWNLIYHMLKDMGYTQGL